MNFNIVEDTTPRYLDKFDRFVELYNNRNVSVKQICKELGWSNNLYNQARKQALSDGLIQLRSVGNKGNNKKKHEKKIPLNYSQNTITGKYTIRKRKGDTIIYYGSYSNLQTVTEIVRLLRDCNWDKEKYPSIREECIKKYGK